MRERPILFSTAMVRAILGETKRVTRRVVKPQPQPFAQQTPDRHEQKHPAPYIDAYCGAPRTEANPRGMTDLWCWWTRDNRQGAEVGRCPYGVPGDRLWVRETHYRFGHWEPVPGARTKGGRTKWMFVVDSDETLFDAPTGAVRLGRHHKDPATPAWHKRLARFMPHRLSRITLEVTSIRVERLHDISEEDARAEGVEAVNGHEERGAWYGCGPSHREGFAQVWWDINGRESLAADPYVWVITFRRLP